MPITVSRLGVKEFPDWEELLTKYERDNFYYLPAWFDVLELSYGHKCILFLARDENGRVIGGLPLVLIEKPILGRKAISLPYQVSVGGPICESPEVARKLIDDAVDFTRSRNAKFIEFRDETWNSIYRQCGFETFTGHGMETVKDLAELSEKLIWKGHRLDLKKARRNQITTQEAKTIEEWRIFHELFEEQQRGFAVPGYGWNLFHNLYLLMPEKAKVRLAWRNGRCLGGVLLLCHGTTIYFKQAVTPAEHLGTGAGKLLLWEAMVWGREANYERFNFGLSLNSQIKLRAYKEGFGGVSSPLSTHVLAIRGTAPNYAEYYEGFGVARSLWRRLPLGLTKRLGGYMAGWYC